MPVTKPIFVSVRLPRGSRAKAGVICVWPLSISCQAKGNPWGAIADIQILLAIIYIWSGERDAALQQLAETAKLSPMPIALIPGAVGLSAGDLKLNPVWDELRDDSRFAHIITEAAKPIKLD